MQHRRRKRPSSYIFMACDVAGRRSSLARRAPPIISRGQMAGWPAPPRPCRELLVAPLRSRAAPRRVGRGSPATRAREHTRSLIVGAVPARRHRGAGVAARGRPRPGWRGSPRRSISIPSSRRRGARPARRRFAAELTGARARPGIVGDSEGVCMGYRHSQADRRSLRLACGWVSEITVEWRPDGWNHAVVAPRWLGMLQ
jgi:hypothetical protein